jgi:hypothetical protein
VSVIDGEGRVPILYGSFPLPQPPHRNVYVARPDLVGTFGGIVLSHDQPGPSPTIKAVARKLARYGFAVVAVDPGDVRLAVDALDGEWDEWAREPFAYFGIGSGAEAAVQAAAVEGAPVLLLSPPLDDPEALAGEGTLFVATTVGEAASLRDRVGRGIWAVYRDKGSRFWDDNSDDFSYPAYEDVFERAIGFLDRHVGAPETV